MYSIQSPWLKLLESYTEGENKNKKKVYCGYGVAIVKLISWVWLYCVWLLKETDFVGMAREKPRFIAIFFFFFFVFLVFYMRIRKRYLSLSAAAVPGSSDLHGGYHHHNHHPPLLLVQHQQVHPNGNLRVLYDNTNSQPSDPPPNHCCFPPPPCSADQIGVEPSTWVSSGAGSQQKKTIAFPHKEVESESKIEIIKTNDTGRKESILCPEASSCASTPLLPSPPTNANLVLKGWLEGDRLIPIKKRRGSFGKKMNHDVEEDNEMVEETMKPKPTKRNDKCVAKQEVISATCPKKNNKNGKRGNVIMVGSRCSRVNGRGWRCCQQTLVGYSLCEHHLGKGRLRSMTSFRGRAQKVAPKEQAITKEMISIDNQELEDDDDDEEEEEEELKGWEEESKSSVEGMKKFSKKKKLGVVKARSLSSLLSQMGS
ncbi:hypothetical protein L6452_37451 [Arctium lappa]|uniref:Uncharacterized protein n=1 Tax=Arctium lappa TaxID=4217 RepID=A0ACB8Y458_ARCLA|nr:hypothetical protein L6452_37451 [Arctium lappa]